MKSAKRRRLAVCEAINKEKEISVEKLAEMFNVSKVTIRHDLNSLQADGYIFRTHGKANALDRRTNIATQELSVEEKSRRQSFLKTKLANQALKLIEDYETIFIDSGSTTLSLARQISRKRWKALTVITNSVPICEALSNVKGVEVIATGGRLRKKSKSFAGEMAERAVISLEFGKLFLSADGYDITEGITTHSEAEASLNRVMCAVAKQIVVISDYTKFGRVAPNWIINFDAVNTVITDSGVESAFIELIREKGVDVIKIDA